LAEHDGKSFRWRSIKQPTVQVSRAAGVELAWRAPGGTAVACRAGSGGFLGLFTWSCHLVFIVGIVLDLAVSLVCVNGGRPYLLSGRSRAGSKNARSATRRSPEGGTRRRMHPCSRRCLGRRAQLRLGS
jgi:hypothetical protein